ncbi:MAG: hypothetical protein ACR2KK_21870 [Acidimicrobiales bacterium]
MLVDITCDLMDEDETGFVWTFLSEAREPGLIEPGAIVVAGDEDAPAVAEVVDVVRKPAGQVVHLRVLPGAIDDYEALIRRPITRVSGPVCLGGAPPDRLRGQSPERMLHRRQEALPAWRDRAS